jgi:predicted nuclease with TOPRIM domain
LIEESSVPLSKFEELQKDLAAQQEKADAYYLENQQLKEVLKNMNVGITKASNLTDNIKEELIRVTDQKQITDLAFNLLKHHPKSLIIKHRGGIVLEIKEDDKGEI